jgi:hypothetical protein
VRSFRHWTPRYIWDRTAWAIFQRRYPATPWITPTAVAILSDCLRPTDVGIEFGSGRSTAWFAARMASITSFENNPTWHAKVEAMLKHKGCTNVDLRLYDDDRSCPKGEASCYVQAIDEWQTASLDFALVDGICRDHCALKVIDKLQPGGLLVIDNVNWYLPSNSRSPASRSRAQGPHGPVWQAVADRLRDWRFIWTSSGVTDTAIYFKPC